MKEKINIKREEYGKPKHFVNIEDMSEEQRLALFNKKAQNYPTEMRGAYGYGYRSGRRKY